MKKKLILLFLCMVILFGVLGCKKEDNVKENDNFDNMQQDNINDLVEEEQEEIIEEEKDEDSDAVNDQEFNEVEDDYNDQIIEQKPNVNDEYVNNENDIIQEEDVSDNNKVEDNEVNNKEDESEQEEVYSISKIDGVGESFKKLVCAGSGCVDGTMHEVDENGTLKGYNLCKVDSYEITNIVKDNIGGTDYLFFYYTFTSSLIAGELGEYNTSTSCTFLFNVYNSEGLKINNDTIDLLGYAKAVYTSFNMPVIVNGNFKVPLDGVSYSIEIVVAD